MATSIYLGNPPENIVKWIKENSKPAFKLTDPLCFTAEEPNAMLSFSDDGSNQNQVVFSYDKQNWSSYEYGTEITLANVGDKVYFRAADDVENGSFNGYHFYYSDESGEGTIAASGNLNTLLKADGSVLDLTGRDYCYAYMFEGLPLTQAPALPATTLSEGCYSNMFNSCYLTEAPELPATTLADNCYEYMFSNNCTSLTKAPALPATTLADNCYECMFQSCRSLTKAPELPATTLANNCYEYMFENCESLTQAPELPATTLAAYCYTGMFSGCGLTEAPELPATELAEGCYSSMFYYCDLTQAPALPATTLSEDCYSYMFAYCTALTQASFPNLEKETVATEVVESQEAFVDAASDIEATCKDGILVINSTEV